MVDYRVKCPTPNTHVRVAAAQVLNSQTTEIVWCWNVRKMEYGCLIEIFQNALDCMMGDMTAHLMKEPTAGNIATGYQVPMVLVVVVVVLVGMDMEKDKMIIKGGISPAGHQKVQ